jgi:hypothetical protein
MTSAPRSFLLTVYESPAAVLEDLSTRQREHVPDIAALGEHVSRALTAAPGSDGRAGQDALLEGDGRGRGLDAQLVDEGPPAGEELT